MDPKLVEEWVKNPVTVKLLDALREEREYILDYLGRGGIRGSADEIVQNYNLQVGRLQMIDTLISLEHLKVKSEETEDGESTY